jgi:formylglycine-generating enzyme required for sulfatase activity
MSKPDAVESAGKGRRDGETTKRRGVERMGESWTGAMVALALVCGGCGGWREVPPVPGGDMMALEFGRCEVTAGEFAEWLNEGGVKFAETAQLERGEDGKWQVRRGVSRRAAVSEVTREEAEGYAAWLGKKEERVVRLPSGEEWEWAARGGVRGAPWPWGWGGEPKKMACVDALAPAPRTGMYPANGYGLRDMAGNVFEWVGDADEARGGAWSEPDVECLRVEKRQGFPKGYRGRDVGFRVVRESLKRRILEDKEDKGGQE